MAGVSGRGRVRTHNARGSKEWGSGVNPDFGKPWFLLLGKTRHEQAALLFRDLRRLSADPGS